MNNNNETVLDLSINNSQKRPNDTAYTFLENGEHVVDSLSYQQLDNQARSLAAQLTSHYQLQKGDTVILLFCPGLDFIRGLFACLYGGFIAVPVNPPSSNGQSWANFLAIVDNSKTAVILADQTKEKFLQRQYLVNKQSPSCPIVDIATLNQDLSNTYVKPAITSNDIALLQYTSGSTGIPKGVMVTHSNIMHNLQGIADEVYQSKDNNITVSWLPVYHDMGLFGGVLVNVLLAGHYIFMAPTSFLLKPLRWLKAVDHYRAKVVGMPNFAYELCAESIDDEQLKGIDLSCLNIASSGAEPVLAETLKKFTRRFFKYGFKPHAFVPSYGLAESTLLVCAKKKDELKTPTTISIDKDKLEDKRVELTELGAENSRQFVSCGVTKPGSTVIVDPETLQSVNDRLVGEIWIRSPSISPGYWNDPVKTAEVFNAEVNGEGGFYRTGDFGFLHEGEIFITGRLKDLIIIHGKNHYPADIEQTVQLQDDALIKNAGAVFSVDIGGIEYVVVTQEVHQNYIKSLDAQGVINRIKMAVSEHHEIQLHGVMLLPPGRIFKTSSGKIRRSACREHYLNEAFDQIDHWQSSFLSQHRTGAAIKHRNLQLDRITELSQSAILANMVQWIAYRLDVESSTIDVDGPYAVLGLDSVDVISLIGDLGRSIGFELDPVELGLWELESMSEMAEAIYQSLNNASIGGEDQSGEIEGFI